MLRDLRGCLLLNTPRSLHLPISETLFVAEIIPIGDGPSRGPTPICKRPACANQVSRPDRGRPPDYCSTDCQQLFNREKNKIRGELRRLTQLCAAYDVDVDPADGRDVLEDAFTHFVHDVEQIRALARRSGGAGTRTDLSEIAQRLGDARDRAYDRLQQ